MLLPNVIDKTVDFRLPFAQMIGNRLTQSCPTYLQYSFVQSDLNKAFFQ